MSDDWKAVQKRTFTRWVNQQLKERNMSVNNISEDFKDGVILCNLIEILTKKKVGRFKKKPKMRIHKVENCQMAVNRMKKEGMKCVNIGGTDIAGSDEKLIMGVLWQLILKYEINKGGSGGAAEGRKKLLKWVRKQIPTYNITNFNTNWNDGKALNALNNSIQPGLCAKHRQLDPNDALGNARRGMAMAEEALDIGQLIDPEDLINPKVDEHAMLTYLAQYMDAKPKDPVLSWVQEKIPEYNITNFTTDWVDGRALNALNDALQPGLCAHHRTLSPNDRLKNVAMGMNTAAQVLGVSQVLKPKDMIKPQGDGELVMNYLAQFMDATPNPLLAWVRETIPEYNICNFTTDWNDGRALNALNNALQPGLCANHKTLNPEDGLNNIIRGMDVASQALGVSQLVKPADMINPEVNEQAMMSHLSQYMDVQPDPLLAFLREKIPEYNIQNFNTDWNDGRALNALNNALQPGLCANHRKLNRGHRTDRLENVNRGMNVAEQALGVSQLIRPEEMINPRVKEVAMMNYLAQYMMVEEDPLLEWVREKIPKYNIRNFTTDWNDGRALNALNNALQPGLCVGHRKLNRADKIENVNMAMDVAAQALGVSKLVRPEDMIDPGVDEMAMKTHIGQYMAVKPNPLLGWLQEKIPEYNITNLTTDWNDGCAINALNDAMMPGLCSGHAELDQSCYVDNADMGINTASQVLGVSKLITPEQMINPKVCHADMEQYLGQFMAATPPDNMAMLCSAWGNALEHGVACRPMHFGLSKPPGCTGQFEVKVQGPTGTTVPVSINDMGGEDGYDVCYTPDEPGNYMISVTLDGEHIPGSVFSASILPAHMRLFVGSASSSDRDTAISTIEDSIAAGKDVDGLEDWAPVGILGKKERTEVFNNKKGHVKAFLIIIDDDYTMRHLQKNGEPDGLIDMARSQGGRSNASSKKSQGASKKNNNEKKLPGKYRQNKSVAQHKKNTGQERNQATRQSARLPPKKPVKSRKPVKHNPPLYKMIRQNGERSQILGDDFKIFQTYLYHEDQYLWLYDSMEKSNHIQLNVCWELENLQLEGEPRGSNKWKIILPAGTSVLRKMNYIENAPFSFAFEMDYLVS